MFDPEDTPESAYEQTESADDQSGVFEWKTREVHGMEVHKGDLIIEFRSDGCDLGFVDAIVVPQDAMGVVFKEGK